MMNNEELNRTLEKTRMKIAIANLEGEGRMKNITKFKMAAGFILAFVLTSGIVFATVNYKKIINQFHLGEGIDTAVEHGYIAEPEQDYVGSNMEVNDESTGIVLDNIKADVKIDDFLMDDVNLSTHFNFKFDEAIKETVNISKLGSMEIKDLIVTDEEQRILFCVNKEAFEKYCTQNNLPYVFGEFNENYQNNGLNMFIASKDAKSNNVVLTYNMYGDEFPKSKKLNFHFNTIILTEGDKSEKDGKKVFLKGEWNINLDVPEKMYNRQSIAYKVVSCSEEDFNVYKASVSDTGFEIGISVNTEDPNAGYAEKTEKLRQEKEAGKISQEEYEKMIDKTRDELVIKGPITALNYEEAMKCTWGAMVGKKIRTDELMHQSTVYVENDNGKKFESTMSPSRKANANFINDNTFDFYETLGMTTYDATDRVTVTVLYYGNPVKIELEKNK